MALEAWEIVAIAVTILILLKPSLIVNTGRKLGKIMGEYKKGKSNKGS